MELRVLPVGDSFFSELNLEKATVPKASLSSTSIPPLSEPYPSPVQSDSIFKVLDAILPDFIAGPRSTNSQIDVSSAR